MANRITALFTFSRKDSYLLQKSGCPTSSDAKGISKFPKLSSKVREDDDEHLESRTRTGREQAQNNTRRDNVALNFVPLQAR